jgi:AcrR family transcriptional regulator
MQKVGIMTKRPEVKPPPAIAGVKQSKQSRSQKTTQRIVDAALKLINKKPFEEVAVEEIAQEAGVSIGGFYARFESKEALLHWFDNNLLEQELEIRLDQFDPERWKDAPLEQAVRNYLEHGAIFLRRYKAPLARIALLLRGTPEHEAAARARSFNERAHAPFLQLLQERRSEIAHPDPEMAARIGLMTISAALREAILFDQRRAYRIQASDRKLLNELTQMFLAYLGVSGS